MGSDRSISCLIWCSARRVATVTSYIGIKSRFLKKRENNGEGRSGKAREKTVAYCALFVTILTRRIWQPNYLSLSEIKGNWLPIRKWHGQYQPIKTRIDYPIYLDDLCIHVSLIILWFDRPLCEFYSSPFIGLLLSLFCRVLRFIGFSIYCVI